ncbi:MAG: sugar ABC transporter permease [Anaerolineae bacterium]|nr:sugar ABC transporter permease [Phycisphaerae bacterium]
MSRAELQRPDYFRPERRVSLASRAWSLQHRLAPYLFVLPFVLLFAIFILYPLVRSLILSTYKTVGPRHEIFAGLDNYRFVLGDRVFALAVTNTIGYTIAFLFLQIPLALGLALLLNSRRVLARAVYRFAFFSAHLVGQVFVAVLFAQLLSPRSGIVNLGLSKILGRAVEISWLGDPNLAMPSVLIAALWLSVGFGMVYFLAALQAVDQELYEAAEVDGAGRWSTFWHVTLPGIRPVLIFMILVGTIGAFQLFELPWVLFQQTPGPDNRGLTIVMYLFQMGFQVNDLGLASAVGWLLVALNLAVALCLIRFSGTTKEL